MQCLQGKWSSLEKEQKEILRADWRISEVLTTMMITSIFRLMSQPLMYVWPPVVDVCTDKKVSTFFYFLWKALHSVQPNKASVGLLHVWMRLLNVLFFKLKIIQHSFLRLSRLVQVNSRRWISLFHVLNRKFW